MKISIARDFANAPCGRYRAEGPHTGEAFREDFLVPKLKEANPDNPLIIDINGAEGYTPSFLEEAFGGLVRKHGYTANLLAQILKIEAERGYKLYRNVLWDYIQKAASNSK